MTRSASFLFWDQSLNLFVADRLLDGGRLYADVAYPYGPIAAYLYALFASVFGNSITSYNILLLGLSLLNLGLVYLLLRRYVGPWAAAVVAGLGVVPFLMIPGALVGSYSVSPYVPLERTASLAACLLWRSPSRRTRGSAVGLGVVLGLWQGVRFGGAFFFGAAILILDLIALRVEVSNAEAIKRWVRSLLSTLAGFLAVQVAWIAYAVLTMPAAIARDFLWPAYVLDTYRAWVQPGERWPAWGGWNMLFGQQLTPLFGAALGLLVIVLLVWTGTRTRAEPDREWRTALLPLLLPLVFYVVASLMFFRQAFHFYQFAWALVLPVVWPIRLRPGALAVIAFVLLPCFALNAKAQLLNPPDPTRRRVQLPNGEAVWADEGLARDTRVLVDSIRGTGRRSVVILPFGGGIYHFYGFEIPLRQPWIIPGFVRPYDEPGIRSALAKGDDFIVMRFAGQNQSEQSICPMLGGWNPFSPSLCATLDSRLSKPVEIGSTFLLFSAVR
jgi:hypothetical protein